MLKVIVQEFRLASQEVRPAVKDNVYNLFVGKFGERDQQKRDMNSERRAPGCRLPHSLIAWWRWGSGTNSGGVGRCIRYINLPECMHYLIINSRFGSKLLAARLPFASALALVQGILFGSGISSTIESVATTTQHRL